MKRKQNGGELLSQGTFGCVFRPALKCKNKTSSLGNNYVSKILKTKSYNEERSEIDNILKVFKGQSKEWINRYFILPDKNNDCDDIDLSDKETFDDLYKNKSNCDVYSSVHMPETVGSEVHSMKLYKLINAEYGGNSLYDYTETKDRVSLAEFARVNNSLIDFFENGLCKMNDLGVYHFDIKCKNVVYDGTNRIRLIDWGMARIINTQTFITLSEFDINNILSRYLPKNTLDVLYYGAHYGNILRDEYASLYLLKNPTKVDSFVENSDLTWINILKIFCNLPVTQAILKQQNKETDFNKIISNNLNKILSKRLDYFKHIYFHNSDIFAFLIIYCEIYMYSKLSYKKTIKIPELIVKYLLSSDYAVTPFPRDEIINDLKSLNRSSNQLSRLSKSIKRNKKNQEKTKFIRSVSKKALQTYKNKDINSAEWRDIVTNIPSPPTPISPRKQFNKSQSSNRTRSSVPPQRKPSNRTRSSNRSRTSASKSRSANRETIFSRLSQLTNLF